MKISKFLILLGILTTFFAQAKPELTVYSGRDAKFIKPVMAKFTEKTGIKVKVFYSKATALVNRLRLQGNKTRADVFISNDAGALQIGTDMGLFKPIPGDMISMIPKNYRGDKNQWIGLSARARVLVINKKMKAKLGFVKSVADLADKRLRGKIAITHSANGSFISGLTVYQKTWGDEKTLAFLQGLKRNAAGKTYNKHSAIVKDVANGNRAIGLINHYYFFRHIKKNPKSEVELLVPDQGEKGMGVARNVAGMALIKHSKNMKQAKALIKFLVSKQGQSIFANTNQEFPVRKDVKPAKGVPVKVKVAPVPMTELGKSRNKTLSLIEKVGL